MTTQNVVWAMQVRANHKKWHQGSSMQDCESIQCIRANHLIEEDEKNKRQGGIR